MQALASVGPVVGDRSVALEFTVTVRRALRDRYTYASYYLREDEPEIRYLEAGPWAVLDFLLKRFGPHDGGHEAWPAQETIARHAGCSVRSVYSHLAALVGAGLLLPPRRTRTKDGHEQLYYTPGPALLGALERWLDRYPRGE